MSQHTQIRNRLAKIESELRTHVADAAMSGDWPLVKAISDAAESLGSALTDSDLPRTTGKKKQQRNIAGSARRAERSSTSNYPRFLLEDNDLIKVGWSRRDKREYRHRAPSNAIHLVADAIANLSQTAESFSAEDLFPVIDPSDGSDVPTYQGYLVLRWLRHINLVLQEGRSTYRASDPGTLVAEANSSLNRLGSLEELPNE